ncbi:DUF2515 family protein [Brevibacillus fulvus]|uniref:DUF2515 domain-containing protein n=1 Tax=Brevibacillus fulvus TaxID=1125967 RepID=A0A939BUH9_9BACL|nr:hypothetical protein [Brevibacillus fulvus]
MTKLTLEQIDLVSELRYQTTIANRNNVTRTAAYLRFYLAHPEVDWALLAHLVSRNGGWNMTDLRGEWLPRIMSEEEIESFFLFLERSNWLIFHDAYPQLLLYAEAKKQGEDLFHLLPSLGVSRFMVPLWQQFWQKREPRPLTHGLIINEQQYIQQRVVRQPYFQRRVLETFKFQAQSLLSLNQVLFPYKQHPTDATFSIVGTVVHHFPLVEKRIEVGKALYRLLFGNRDRLEKIIAWAKRIPHTGSRADYWPHIFSPYQKSSNQNYQARLNGTRLLPGRAKLYSPRLTDVWPEIDHPPADGVDWYREQKWIDLLEESSVLPCLDTDDYAVSLHHVDHGMQWLDKLT